MHRCSALTCLLGAILLLPGLANCQVRETPSATVPVNQPSDPAGLIPPSNPMSATMTGAHTVLGPGDLLEIGVFDTPELTQRVRVNGEGKIYYSLVGDITVQGTSTESLREIIRKRLIEGRYVKDPRVTIFVVEYAGEMVYVTGEVNRPGAYSLLRSYRLLDLLSVAGGLTDRAANKITIIHESDPKHLIHVDLTDPDAEVSNPEISPGDSVVVGLTGLVYVLGNVTRPGGFFLDRRSVLTVLEALALAEGPTQTASLTNGTLIHSADANPQPIPINLKEILKAQSPDFPLKGGDIIWVGDSQTRNLGRAAIQAILATASGVAVYASYPR